MPEAPKKLPLPPVSIEQAPIARNAWILTAPVDFPYEALMEPRMWINVANRLTLKDSIEVWAEDLSWAAEFRVIDKGHFGVKVGAWSGKKQFAVEVPVEDVPEGYAIEYKNAVKRYCVVRKSDGKNIYEKAPDRAAAAAWLASHLASVKAA